MGSSPVVLYVAVCDGCGLTYDEIDEEATYMTDSIEAEEIAVDGSWHRGADGKVYCEDCPGVWAATTDEDLSGAEPVEVILTLDSKTALVPLPAVDGWLAAHHG